MSFSFYQVGSDEFDQVFFSLVEKSFLTCKKTLILTESNEQSEYYDKMLWTFSQLKFIPHCLYESADFKEFIDYVPVALLNYSKLLQPENYTNDRGVLDGAFDSVILLQTSSFCLDSIQNQFIQSNFTEGQVVENQKHHPKKILVLFYSDLNESSIKVMNFIAGLNQADYEFFIRDVKGKWIKRN